MAYFKSNYNALAHHWVYNFDNSHCYGNRMYSEGNEIYSYGSHYIIAKYDPEKDVFFFNMLDSSNTTNKQRQAVLDAIPRHKTVFKVRYIDPHAWKFESQYPKFIKDWFRYIEEQAKLWIRARSKKVFYAEEISNTVQQIKDFMQMYNVEYELSDKEKAYLENPIETNATELKKAIDEDRRKAKEAAKKRIEKFRRHEISSVPTNVGYFLRISKDGEYIESSNGAHMKIEEAKKIYGDLKRNSIQTNYGPYRAIYDEKRKVLHLGCHAIRMDEIEKTMNAIKEANK